MGGLTCRSPYTRDYIVGFMPTAVVSITVRLRVRTQFVGTILPVFTAVRTACSAPLYMPRRCLSVRLSVRPFSVTQWYCVETNEATIMRFSPTGRTIILVSGEVKIVWKFVGDHL